MILLLFSLWNLSSKVKSLFELRGFNRYPKISIEYPSIAKSFEELYKTILISKSFFYFFGYRKTHFLSFRKISINKRSYLFGEL